MKRSREFERALRHFGTGCKERMAPPELLRDVKVLVVDDNRTNCRILEGMLVRWQMKPSVVNGGMEALERFCRPRGKRASPTG